MQLAQVIVQTWQFVVIVTNLRASWRAHYLDDLCRCQPRLQRSALWQLMCVVVIDRLSAFDPTRESRNVFKRNLIFRFVLSYSPCCVQDKLISAKSVRTLRRLFILCIAAGGWQLELERPKHAANCRLPAGIYLHRMSNPSCAVTDFLLNIFWGLFVPVLVQVAQHHAHAQTRVSPRLSSNPLSIHHGEECLEEICRNKWNTFMPNALFL
jgi:hypothetical protein